MGGQDQYALEIEASVEALASVAEFIEEKGEALSLPFEVRRNLELAADEAVTNVAFHAYPPDQKGRVRLVLSNRDGWAELAIEDQGQAFTMDEAQPPDLEAELEERRIGGLGLYFMEQLTDELRHERVGETNRLVLRKRLLE